MKQWAKYFPDSDLPITCYFSADLKDVKKAVPAKDWRCLICELSRVVKGESLAYNAESLVCGGAKRYLGYTDKVMPNFEYFLSHGIVGKLEGERYKKSPEIVVESQKQFVKLPSEGKYAIFKRWDNLEEYDIPEVVIFFAKPDVLSGLFTLANFDRVDNGVIVPFSAGCGSIIHYPYLEKDKEKPDCVIGMFDPSARPCVPKNTLSFAAPMNRFLQMINYMDESFLITDTWKNVQKRIKN